MRMVYCSFWKWIRFSANLGMAVLETKFYSKNCSEREQSCVYKVGNKRFIDSHLFITIPFRKFSKTFTIGEKEKVCFPRFHI